MFLFAYSSAIWSTDWFNKTHRIMQTIMCKMHTQKKIHCSRTLLLSVTSILSEWTNEQTSNRLTYYYICIYIKVDAAATSIALTYNVTRYLAHTYQFTKLAFQCCILLELHSKFLSKRMPNRITSTTYHEQIYRNFNKLLWWLWYVFVRSYFVIYISSLIFVCWNQMFDSRESSVILIS